MRPIITCCTAVLAVLLVACSSSPKPPATAPGITGTVTSLRVSGNAATILVEADEPQAGAVSDKANVTVTSETTVLDIGGDRVGVEALGEGMVVSVWFEGPVAESYPVQGTAGFIQQMP